MERGHCDWFKKRQLWVGCTRGRQEGFAPRQVAPPQCPQDGPLWSLDTTSIYIYLLKTPLVLSFSKFYLLKMTHFSSTQYNSITDEYNAVNDIPVSRVLVINVERVVKPHTKGARVLDLACGTGFFTRHLLDWGASSIVGVDVSQGMVDVAKAETSQHPGAAKSRFMVADCSAPFDAGAGEFDLVFAAWLLNYSKDEGQMVAMFENISRHLKPGGRLVTVIPNVGEDPMASDVHDQLCGNSTRRQRAHFGCSFG